MLNSTIQNIDFKDLIKQFQKEKTMFIDAVITDPPYNISRKNNFKTIGRSRIDFGEWDYVLIEPTELYKLHHTLKKEVL
ncbi:hypothetical protein [Mycoplasma sp. CSL10166]|uniref:hypothetical protein n=1 Tax=Mycoplasma sp. CSL10166 TaxID=2813825 RepID=UPI00197C806B|nr:hypothetical protein [Mycoplasma sp. CSL10166]MBN4084245.1 hypothetical protein [Mycoplasma sp. CSL10166]